MQDYPLKPRSNVDLLDKSFDVLREQFGPIVRLYVVAALLAHLLSELLVRLAGDLETATNWGAFAASIVLHTLITAFFAFVVTRHLADRLMCGSNESRHAGDALAKLPRIVATETLSLVLVLAGLLLVVPGFWAMVAFTVTSPVMAIEGTFGTAALSRSRRLMRGHKRRAIVPLAVWLLLEGVTAIGFDAMLGADSVSSDLLYAGASALLHAYIVVYSLLLYLDVRFRGEAFDLEVLARRVAHGATS